MLSAWAYGQTTFLAQTLAGTDDVRDGLPALQALLSHVEGIAVDAGNNLYIADADGHRLRKVTPGGIISTIAGNGHPGLLGDGGPAAGALLNTPYGVAVDGSGNIYLADLGNARIRRIAPDGTISTIAGGGGTPALQADGHPAIQASLAAPRNVTVDASGNVYFSDFVDHRVYQININGILLRVAGSGSPGSAGDNGPALLAQLNSPAGLAIDGTGALYIADSGNARIRRVVRGVITAVTSISGSRLPVGVPTGVAFDHDGSLYIADAGNGQVLKVTPALQASAIGMPARDVALDPAGNLLTCSGPYVYRKLRTSAVFTLAAGSGAFGFSGDGGPASKARLNVPSDVARGSLGDLYVADTGNHRVRRISPDMTISTIAGSGLPGSTGDNDRAVSAQLNRPSGVAADAAGNVYVADTGNHKVRRIDLAGNIYTVAGTGARGYSGDNGPAFSAQLDTPGGVALDSAGNLYIADTGNHAIRRVSPDGSIATVAGNGTRGSGGDGGPALSARLDSPSALCLDALGTMYIADTGNRRIRRVSAADSFGPGVITTFPAGGGVIWRSLRGVTVDAGSNVYVSDAADQRVYRVELTGRITTIAGDGLQGFNGESAAGLSLRLDTPAGLIVDPAGNIFVADSGNGRLRKLTPNIDLDLLPPPADTVAAVNAASLLPGAVAPGEIVSLFGAGFGPAAPLTPTPADALALPSQLGSTQVIVNGGAAPLLFAQQNQVNFQVPYSIGDTRSVDVQVVVGGVTRAKLTLPVADAAIGLFAAAAGAGQALAINEDGSANSEAAPVARGSIVTLFATGEGRVSPQPLDGGIAGYPSPAPVLPVSVRIGDYPAQVDFAQSAPGYAGLLQINARVPGGFAPAGVLPVIVKVGSSVSQPGVTIAVR